MNSTPADTDNALKQRLARIEQLLPTDAAAAEQQVSALLAATPDHPAALLLQGVARRFAGRTDDAIDSFSRLCALRPDLAAAHFQLGLAQREAGRNPEAAASMRRSVELLPDFIDGWRELADLLFAMGDGPGADAAFGAYIRHSTRDPRLQKPAEALRRNQPAEAEQLLRAHLQQHRNDIAALCMLADVALRFNRLADARTLLERCLVLAPGYRTARHNLAVLSLRENRLGEALSLSDGLLADAPGEPAYLNLRAAVLGRMGEYEECARIYEQLVAAHADKPKVWMSLGHMLRTLGRRDESEAAYRKTIELAPHFGEAYWNLANFKTRVFSDADVEAMRAQLARPQLDDENRLHFHFAIGKALEDRCEYGDAFGHYADGNRIRRATVRYRTDDTLAYVQSCKELFTREFFDARRGAGAAAPDPIFVVGLPRTGSTLVEQILASHSSVEGTTELPDLIAIADSVGRPEGGSDDADYFKALAALTPDALAGLGHRYIESTRIHRKSDRPGFIDKTPNNFAHVGLIHLILPNARIVDVRRHPMACGMSNFKHLFARGQTFSYDLEEIGAYYRAYVDLMTHFDAVLPGRVHRVIYESLIADTEAEVRRLLAYCGLPFEQACLEFHANPRPVNTPSSEQVRRPITADAVDHWRHFEPWLGPLKTALGSTVDAYPGTGDPGGAA